MYKGGNLGELRSERRHLNFKAESKLGTVCAGFAFERRENIMSTRISKELKKFKELKRISNSNYWLYLDQKRRL